MTRVGPLVLALLLPAAGFGAAADSIAAVVGGTAILESEIRQAVDFFRIASADTVTPDEVLREQVLDQLISNEVLQERARHDTLVTITTEEIDAGVDAQVATLKQRFEDEDQFRAALAAEGLTERILRGRYEDDVERKLLSQRLMEAEGLTRIYVSPAEAERFYELNKDSIARVPGRATLAHILMMVTPAEAVEVQGQERAAEVLDILSRGGDFATVAQSFSDDTKTAPRGGDWGYRDLPELPIDIALVLDQLETGQVSPPFRSLEGYMILALEQKSGTNVKFRSILFKTPVTRADTVRTRATAASYRAKVLAGASFDSLARVVSMDPTTRDSGGFLGDFMLEGLTAPFDSVIVGLDSGDVSEPVMSEHGFHLVQVLDKVDERTMGYLEMQDGIRNYLYQEKLNQRLAEYLKRISKDVYVKRF